MNVARLKVLLWLVSLAVAGYLGWFVYQFLTTKDVESRGVTEEEQRAALESVEVPEPPKDDVVSYDAIRVVFNAMNWTGKEPPKPVDETEDTGPVETPKTPVSDLLDVLLIQFDSDAPEGSLALVAYKDGTLEVAATKDREEAVLRPGETLAASFDYIEVDRIDVEGVRFVFTNDEEREPEVVAPLPFPSDRIGIVAVGPEGALVPANTSTVGIRARDNYPAFRPDETQVVGKNQYLIGTQTAARFEEDYSRILSQDVSYKPYRNPKTRQIEGLRVTRVRGGSVVAQHGISEGEILKSINGHKVTSASDAISYVKKTADETDTWVAVFERQGREIVRTYKSPPPE